MKIAELRAYPTSFALPPDASVTLSIGRAVKRGTVVATVTTDLVKHPVIEGPAYV